MGYNTILPVVGGVTTLTANAVVVGDALIGGKLDIGLPGVSGGLDVGEGGSYSVGLVAYTYDASAGSGSRFTVIADLNGTNALTVDAGDRIYFGHVNKFWAVRTELSVAKSTEKFIFKYWNGALTASSYMGILKDDANTLGDAVMLQTIQKEYITWEIDINTDWVTVDNQVDLIPNTGTPRYWMCLENPIGDLTIAPTITEIKIRGSDFDVISGTAFPVFWGLARVAILERITLDISPGGGGAVQDQDIATNMIIRVVAVDAEGDNIGFIWVLPDVIDTSCGLIFSVDYISENAQQLTINMKLKKLKTAVVVGSSETTDLDEDTTFTVAAADVFVSGQALNANPFSIQDLLEGDSVAIQVTMKTMPNTGASNEFIPTSFRVTYVRWTSGQHLT